jgi:uncharacterized protein
MKLDLSEIAATIDKHIHYEINEECTDFEDVRCTEPIKGSIDFTNTGQIIVALGSFKTTIELECSRCLEQFPLPISARIEELLPIKVMQAAMAGHSVEIDEEEEEPLFQDNMFDLSEFLRQSILVQAPIKPLCDELCKGLCPTCGSNLNGEPCGCPVDVSDSPFAVLADIVEDHEKGKEHEK